jgi:hypothetical protein
MLLKFLLQYLDEEGNVIKEIPMKTLRQINEVIPIEYFQVRQLYLHCKNKTNAHPFIKEYAKRYRIIDNPVIYNFTSD